VFDWRADCRKARRALGWEPAVGFAELVRMMVDADLADLQRQIKGGAEAVRVAAEMNP
jgi:GDPmannose 4,6-dehydratase